MNKICSKCPCVALAKGLCKRCYYAAKRSSSDPKDVAIYRKRPAQLSAQRYANLDREQRIASVSARRSKRRKALYSVVPDVCALRDLSPCSDDSYNLHQDHDHSCKCGNRTGCQNCFRGVLCMRHNRLVLPILDTLNEEHIPDIVKSYLTGRPLFGTQVHPHSN